MNNYSIVKCSKINRYKNLTIEQLLNYNDYMEIKRTDCEAVNPDIVNKVLPDMPDFSILYDLSDFFKVMGDSTRIRLLWALEQAGMCVNDLAVLLDMTKSAVSHQLKILRTAKLVKAEKRGKNVYYSLADEHVQVVLDMALNHIKE